jgi:hypothetical protein
LVVLRALGLGDLLTAVPALRGLAAAFPGHRRLLAAPASLRPLIDLLSAAGTAYEVVDTDFRRRFSPLPPALHGADVAVNLHGRGPQSHAALSQAQPRELLTYRHPGVPASAGGPDWDEEAHEVDRWCRLLHSAGIAADPTRLTLDVPKAPAPPGSDPEPGVTIVHPGAGTPARRWPAARWAQVAMVSAAAGHRIVVTGGDGEVDLAREVARRAGLPTSAVLAGRTDLRRLMMLVASARLVLSGDTGVAHLAVALRIPSVVVFGPVSPTRWGPRIDPQLHRVLWSGMTGEEDSAAPDPGLLRITADMVLETFL